MKALRATWCRLRGHVWRRAEPGAPLACTRCAGPADIETELT